MIDDEALVLGQVLDHHPQHVVGLATHQVAFHCRWIT
jgi:hypothetical protein